MKRLVKKSPNIVLVGFMGTGKTAIGNLLSSQLLMRYVDTDDVVEQDSGRSISDIFAEDGEPTFRELESEAVRKVSKLHNHVISTGGGAVLKEINMTALKQNGIVFCLTATAEEIYKRIGQETHRPLLQTTDPLERIRSMVAERGPYYAEADFMIETTGRSLDEITAHIERMFRNRTRNPK